METFDCYRCGAPNADAIDGGDLLVCEECV